MNMFVCGCVFDQHSICGLFLFVLTRYFNDEQLVPSRINYTVVILLYFVQDILIVTAAQTK